MAVDERIRLFLEATVFGVVGASADRRKYGNKVLRCYLQNRRRAVPVNPRAPVIEGVACVGQVRDLPAEVTSLSVITPPPVTELVVEQAARHGVKRLWMQPGAESEAALAACRRYGIDAIADGSCVLVVLGYRDDWVPGV